MSQVSCCSRVQSLRMSSRAWSRSLATAWMGAAAAGEGDVREFSAAAFGEVVGAVAGGALFAVDGEHRWQNQFGGMKANDAKAAQGTGAEDAQVKCMVADRELELTLCVRSQRETGSPSRRRRTVIMLQERLRLSQPPAFPGW